MSEYPQNGELVERGGRGGGYMSAPWSQVCQLKYCYELQTYDKNL